MAIHELTSKDNPLLKTIRLLASGSRRASNQLVLAEGIRVLEEVNKAGREIEAVLISEDFGSAPRENQVLNEWRTGKIRIYKASARLFQSISTVQTPQGAIALVKLPQISLSSIIPKPNWLMVCACGIQDPGNLGTLIRAAAASGADMVCTTKGTVSARSPKAIRSSAGSFFRLPVAEHTEIAEFRRYCQIHTIRPYRTHSREGVIYTEADLKSSCAILLGNEGGGISEKDFSGFQSVRIPMAEATESLNVAIAGAIILFEARRQRINIRNSKFEIQNSNLRS
jgi:TrmH family RNA methyltransferase